MKSIRKLVRSSGMLVGILLLAFATRGCVAEVHGPPGQVDIVDDHGYHHQGYYDDQHNWHGGYDDENHVHHDDPPDWHQ